MRSGGHVRGRCSCGCGRNDLEASGDRVDDHQVKQKVKTYMVRPVRSRNTAEVIDYQILETCNANTQAARGFKLALSPWVIQKCSLPTKATSSASSPVSVNSCTKRSCIGVIKNGYSPRFLGRSNVG